MVGTKTVAGAAIAAAAIEFFSSAAVAKPPGNYPNFTGAGVHGNPAIIEQYGDWVYGEYGSQDGVPSSNLQINKRLGDSHINITRTQGKGVENNIASVAAMPTHELAIGVSEASAGNTTFGIAHISKGSNSLVRAGIAWTPETKSGSAALEWRVNTGETELTLSVRKELRKAGGKFSDRETKAGIQVKKGKKMLSVGVAGPGWRDIVLHGRKFQKDGNINLTIRAPGGNFSKGYVGFGITKNIR